MNYTLNNTRHVPSFHSGGGADPDLCAVGDRDLRAVPRAVGRRLLPHRTRPRVTARRRRRDHLRARTGTQRGTNPAELTNTALAVVELE